jgi:hypothetical protein
VACGWLGYTESATEYLFKWVTKPTVREGDAAGNVPPIADANGPYTGIAGEVIAFDSTGSSDPDGTIARYIWAFGDGFADPNRRAD